MTTAIRIAAWIMFLAPWSVVCVACVYQKIKPNQE
jgi:hypothetical protein